MVKIPIKLKSLIKKLPVHVWERFQELFFLHAPIRLIRDVGLNFSGYLQKYIPKNGDVVIDGGAYKGMFTILASRLVGKEGKVLTFEPKREYYVNIKRRIKRLKLKNVTLLKFGLWNKRENLEFTESEYESGISVISPHEKKEVEIIPCISIDEIMEKKGFNKLNFIKADIEGAELEMIEGAQKTLGNNNVHLAIASYHVRDGKKTSEILPIMLKKHGYISTNGFIKEGHPTTYSHKI